MPARSASPRPPRACRRFRRNDCRAATEFLEVYAAPRFLSMLGLPATAFGFFAATRKSASAGPSGVPPPCSQFCKVPTLTPIHECELALRRAEARPNSLDVLRLEHGRPTGFQRVPRRIRPACRTHAHRFLRMPRSPSPELLSDEGWPRACLGRSQIALLVLGVSHTACRTPPRLVPSNKSSLADRRSFRRLVAPSAPLLKPTAAANDRPLFRPQHERDLQAAIGPASISRSITFVKDRRLDEAHDRLYANGGQPPSIEPRVHRSEINNLRRFLCGGQFVDKRRATTSGETCVNTRVSASDLFRP